MSRNAVTALLSLLVIAGAVLGACRTAPPAEEEPIVIGAVFNATGWMAA